MFFPLSWHAWQSTLTAALKKLQRSRSLYAEGGLCVPQPAHCTSWQSLQHSEPDRKSLSCFHVLQLVQKLEPLQALQSCIRSLFLFFTVNGRSKALVAEAGNDDILGHLDLRKVVLWAGVWTGGVPN